MNEKRINTLFTFLQIINDLSITKKRNRWLQAYINVILHQTLSQGIKFESPTSKFKKKKKKKKEKRKMYLKCFLPRKPFEYSLQVGKIENDFGLLEYPSLLELFFVWVQKHLLYFITQKEKRKSFYC